MRSSTTTLNTSRSRARTGVAPSATIRVQRATDTGGRHKPSNSQRRISQHGSTDVPPIPPRTRQTNGTRINLSNSQGIHANFNNGIPQTRNQQRTSNQSLSRTTSNISQTSSRGTTHTLMNESTRNSSSQRVPNRTRSNNKNYEEGRLFPRAPPPAEAARRNLLRTTPSNTNTNTSTTSTNRLTHTNNANANTNIQPPNISHQGDASARSLNRSRIPPQQRTNNSPRNISRPSPSLPNGEPIIPVPNTNSPFRESQTRTTHHQPSPSDNVGSTREPQVLIRSSANSISNRTPTSNSTPNQSPPIVSTATSNTNHHISFNFSAQSNTQNTRNTSETNMNTNYQQPQIRVTTNNPSQQQNSRPTLTNTGTHTAPNPNGDNDGLYLSEDGHLGLFDELFSILDNFPIHIIPFIPMMFESSFGPFLERVIPLYLAHYERSQMIRAIDESMREAENPRPQPPKKVKLINHIVNNDDTKNERECSICLNDFVAGEQTVMLKCGHIYHKDCLMPWFVEHHTCPTCRENVDEADLEA